MSYLSPSAETPCDILILSGHFGGGHNQVAAAIMAKLSAQRPDLRVKTLDFTGAGSPPVSHFLEKSYEYSARWFPFGYSLFYSMTDIGLVCRAVKSVSSRILDRAMRDVLDSYSPKVIVCTHPIPSSVLLSLNLRGMNTPPYITVLTDTAVHGIWLNHRTDAYVVPHECSLREMTMRGVPIERVYPLGLPLLPGFEKPVSPAKDLRESPRILLMGGAMGLVGFAPAIVEEMRTMDVVPHVTIVAGRSEAVREELASCMRGRADRVTVLGYVDDMAELMSQSHLLISKPGGVTVFEALSRGLPVLAYKPIPGQEEVNARFLERIGAGKACRSPRQVVNFLEMLFCNPKTYAAMRKAALDNAKPQAAHDLGNLVTRMLRSPTAENESN